MMNHESFVDSCLVSRDEKTERGKLVAFSSGGKVNLTALINGGDRVEISLTPDIAARLMFRLNGIIKQANEERTLREMENAS